MKAPEAPSTWIGTSRPVRLLEIVERGGDLLHRLVGAGVGDAQDRHNADGVLVDVRGHDARQESARLLAMIGT